jgi:drug/metabolite transporter (DMT)-like permease
VPDHPAHFSATSVASLGFVVLWSTGYIAGAVSVQHAGPFTVLVLRFALSALVFGLLALWAGVPRPKWDCARHSAVVGVLTMAVQFGGLYAALKMGASPALSALVIGSMPLAVTVMAFALGERIQPRQWAGVGIGLVGVLLVISERLSNAHATLAACGALVLGLLGISAGTLYQKRHAAAIDLRTGLFIQNASGALAMLVLAAPLERLQTDLSLPFWLSLGWLVLVNSVGGFALLFLLIRHGEAPKVAALFYLVPPVTALMSRVSMHETLSAPELAGFALATLGVYLGSKS